MVRERGPRQIERTEKWQAKKRAEVLSGGVTPETEQSAVSEAAPPPVVEAEKGPEEELKGFSYRDRFHEDKSREIIIKEIAQDIHDRRWDANRARWLREYNLPLDPDQVHQLLINNHIDPENIEKGREFMEKWDWDQAVQIYEREYGKETPRTAPAAEEPEAEVAPASEPSLAVAETSPAAEPATPAAPEPAEVMQSAEGFTEEQNKVLLRMIAVANNLYKVRSGDSGQQKPEIGDDEARKKIVLDRIKETISDLINKDPITKKIFTEERLPEAIDYVMKFAEKFNSPKKNIGVSETTTETAGPPLIDEKEELIRKKSAGPGKERKDTGLRQLYESLAQKVRLAEIKSKIPEKVSNKEKKILKKRKESLKNVEIALNYIVRDFDEQEVKIIRDYFLVSFMDIYINARKEKERENGKELNAKESVELKKKEFGKIEQNLLDRYRDKIDRYEDKVEKIMDYFWQMSNLEMLLDK